MEIFKLLFVFVFQLVLLALTFSGESDENPEDFQAGSPFRRPAVPLLHAAAGLPGFFYFDRTFPDFVYSDIFNTWFHMF